MPRLINLNKSLILGAYSVITLGFYYFSREMLRIRATLLSYAAYNVFNFTKCEHN